MLTISALVFLFFTLWYFAMPLHPKSVSLPPQPVSIVVVARNELKNLQNFLPILLAQKHPEFEVIVVNNASWDESLEYLTELKKTAPRLKFVNIPEDDRFRSGKKLAITLGIKAASYQNILLTDADCYPASEHWAAIMSSYFAHGNLILGLSQYQKQPGLLNFFIGFETLYTALQYTGFALRGKPYMGVGRNMGYTQELFYSVKGFASHHYLPAGDDDLFVRDVSATANVQVCLNPAAKTISLPKTTWKDWMHQKTRHLNTGKFYKPGIRVLLLLLHSSVLVAFGAFLYAALSGLLVHALIPFTIMLLAFWIVAGIFAYRMDEKRLIAILPLLLLLFPIYLIFFGLRTYIIKNLPW